jgi:hypothetical protein
VSDKRTVSTDALETLGTIIGPNEKRDAIHLAVIPVECGEAWIEPGADVKLEDGVAVKCARIDPDALGIVDPFLNNHAHKGQHFWLVIYPRVITSLRHVWTHPQLPDELSATLSPERAASEEWLRNRADSLGITYQEILGAGADTDYPGCFGNDIDGPRDIEPEFWEHVERVTGNVAPANKRPDWFRCAC